MPVRRAASRVDATLEAMREVAACHAAIARLDLPEVIPPRWARLRLLPFIRYGFADYQVGWFHRALAEAMERFSAAIARGESPRLIVTVPPRHGKSEIVSRRWPVWHLGNHPDHELVLASYGQSLANDMSRDARQVRDDALELWPGLQARADKDGVEQWKIVGGRGGYKAVGVGGPLTGSGAHALIIDDPVKDRLEADSPTYRERVWQWYQTVASTRLAPGAGVLVMMTRWHEDDLVGRLLAEEAKGRGDSWERIDFPAIAEEDETYRRVGEALHPERYAIDVLEQKRRVLGSRNFAALYQQRPVPAQGGTFRREWFDNRYRTDPRSLDLDDHLITCDLTFKGGAGSDYVVFGCWARDGERIYLLDLLRERMDYVTTKRALVDFVARWRHRHPRVLVERKANGDALLSDLGRVVPNLIGWSPDAHGSKETRAEVAAARAEAGQLWLPEDAPWVGDYVDEHLTFPAGKHDDQVDVTSMAVLEYAERGTGAKAETQRMAALFDALGC